MSDVGSLAFLSGAITLALYFFAIVAPFPRHEERHDDGTRGRTEWPGQAMPDGRVPEPGGWYRCKLEGSDLAATVESLHKEGASFRNEIATGVGGKQILLEDPAGVLIELFEPTLPEASLTSSLST
jgi:catechol 2,3-dioxygenase-like lactoylglutathione lyase family enzyme